MALSNKINKWVHKCQITTISLTLHQSVGSFNQLTIYYITNLALNKITCDCIFISFTSWDVAFTQPVWNRIVFSICRDNNVCQEIIIQSNAVTCRLHLSSETQICTHLGQSRLSQSIQTSMLNCRHSLTWSRLYSLIRVRLLLVLCHPLMS